MSNNRKIKLILGSIFLGFLILFYLKIQIKEKTVTLKEFQSKNPVKWHEILHNCEITDTTAIYKDTCGKKYLIDFRYNTIKTI